MESGVHAILGLRGHGKSRLARCLVASHQRLLVIDTLGEYAGTLGQETDPVGLSSALASGPRTFRFVLRPRGDSNSAFAQVEWIERVAAARSGVCLFIDEIDRWYPHPQSTMGEGLFNLVQYGRHYEQSVVAIARRPQRMLADILSQGTLWILPMSGRRDAAVVEDTCGLDPRELRVLQTAPGEDSMGRPCVHNVQVEMARYGSRGVERGTFNLVTGEISLESR